jgi:transposase-like protein
LSSWSLAAATSTSLLSYRASKRNGENTEAFVADLRERVIGTPEISTDGLRFYETAIRFAFGNRVAYGQIRHTMDKGKG